MTAIGSSYSINWGDTLSQIAQRVGSTVQALQAANPKITNPDLIYAGDTLQLPGSGASPAGSGGDTSTAIGTQSVSGPGVVANGSNAAAIAEQFLGRNASELKHSSELPMESWVPNHLNCANFVSACLAKAGLITSGMQSASVATLDGNLQGAGWQKVSVANAQPGDVVIMPGRHVVLFAGHDANGQPKFIGSNNINPDNSQQVSWGGASGNYYILTPPR